MNTKETMQWLMDCGGPVIRYRTAAELMEPGEGGDLAILQAALPACPEVAYWLEQLDPGRFSPRTCHGSADACFENAMGMLAQLGMRAGMGALDEKTQPIRLWLQSLLNDDHRSWNLFAIVVTCSMLASAGYRDPAIMTFARLRLNTLYDFAVKRDYDLYDDRAKYRGVPAGFKDRPILKPELYVGGNYQYPLVYDLYGMAAFTGEFGHGAQDKMGAVLDYILAEEYQQKVAEGYGILAGPDHTYHSMGWDCRLPGFLDIGEEAKKRGAQLVARPALMSRFPGAARNRTFVNVVHHLEGFQTDRGTYLFPAHYLKEGTGYYVSAMHMGLGENRRRKIARELESTFWMLLIKKRAGMI